MLKLLLASATFGTALLLAGLAVQGTDADDQGMTAIRGTTNLDGSGIRIAQPEAGFGSATNWEVNPAYIFVTQPVSKFTYMSSAGTATAFPNSVGGESGHADDSVGRYIYGLHDGFATNVAHIDNYEANYFINNIVAALTPIAASVVNQSFADPDTNNESAYDPVYDDYAAQYKTLFISGVGNPGPNGPVEPPGTAYNSIGVGAYFNRANAEAVGPTPVGGRCKPDITAESLYTSTSCARVTSAAALLEQAALRGDGGATNAAFDLRTIKALLMNGAVKPIDWTNSTAVPLDYRYGAGVLNILNSYKQLTGGKWNVVVTNTVSPGGTHPPTGAAGSIGSLVGWNLATNTSSSSADTIHHYYFDVTNGVGGAKFTTTATLVWMKHQAKTSINQLGLYLYDCANSNLVLCSTSTVDNVQHLWETNLVQGRYDLQVWKAGGSTVTTNETYALVFEFVPQPTLSITGGSSTRLTWPVYPAGYLVETRTNLLSDVWTNSLPVPTVTNGLNNIPVGTTNAVQFFRLRKPNL